jgi:hypothetical protein
MSRVDYAAVRLAFDAGNLQCHFQVPKSAMRRIINSGGVVCYTGSDRRTRVQCLPEKHETVESLLSKAGIAVKSRCGATMFVEAV